MFHRISRTFSIGRTRAMTIEYVLFEVSRQADRFMTFSDSSERSVSTEGESDSSGHYSERHTRVRTDENRSFHAHLRRPSSRSQHRTTLTSRHSDASSDEDFPLTVVCNDRTGKSTIINLVLKSNTTISDVRSYLSHSPSLITPSFLDKETNRTNSSHTGETASLERFSRRSRFG